VNESGKPIPVPKLELTTDEDERRYREAQQRLELRKASRSLE
jgi:hypothetical protein